MCVAEGQQDLLFILNVFVFYSGLVGRYLECNIFVYILITGTDAIFLSLDRTVITALRIIK